MSNSRRIGRDEPSQVVIQVGIGKMGPRNASFPDAEEGEQEKKREVGSGGG